MKKLDKCPDQNCKDAQYTHGSALYLYFSCGHAWEKPLGHGDGEGKLVCYESPYKERYSNAKP